MVGERSERGVIVGIDAERLCECPGSVGLALVFKRLGDLSEVSVEYALQTLAPRSGEPAVGLAVDSRKIALHGGLKLAVHVVVLAVVESLVGLFGHHAVGCPHVGNIESAATLREVDLAVGAYKLVGLVVVGVPYDKHFRQIHGLVSLADDLVFEERIA